MCVMTFTPAVSSSPSENETPLVNILGEKVALGPAMRSQIPTIYRWSNDFRVSVLSGDPLRPVSLESLYAEYDRQNAKEEPIQKWVEFSMYERASMRFIGLTSLRRLDYRNRTATFGIIIGEKDCWHKGYGTEATKLMLDYGFTVLNMHNIELSSYAYNEVALKAYIKAGFREIGRRREAHRWRDRVYDEVIMDCLATEFEGTGTPVLELP